MTAKEMFETTGYKQTTNDDKLNEYNDFEYIDTDLVKKIRDIERVKKWLREMMSNDKTEDKG